MTDLSTQESLVSADEFYEMARDGRRLELVRGRIVEMTPVGWKHGTTEIRVARVLADFVEQRGLGEVAGGEVGHILKRDPDSVLGADVSFISTERFQQVKDPSRFVEIAPDLAVEILSPGDRASEVLDKVHQYLDAGTEAVWIVDPVKEAVTVYRKDRAIAMLGREDELDGDDYLPGFRTPVGKFFGK